MPSGPIYLCPLLRIWSWETPAPGWRTVIRLCRLLDLNADYVLFGAPGDAVQRIVDLLRDRDEETVRVVERTVEALLRALDEQQTT